MILRIFEYDYFFKTGKILKKQSFTPFYQLIIKTNWVFQDSSFFVNLTCASTEARAAILINPRTVIDGVTM